MARPAIVVATFLAAAAVTLFTALSGAPSLFAQSETADLVVDEVIVSYLEGEEDDTPASEADVGEVFRVKVEYTIKNNGPQNTGMEIEVQIMAPEGCVFVANGLGVLILTHTTTIPNNGIIMAFDTVKVRCTTAGLKAFSATVKATNVGTQDPDTNDNSRSDTGPDINIKVSSVTDTPTPTATATPTPPPATMTPTPFIPPEFTATPTDPPTPTPFAFQVPFFSLRADNPSGIDPADILRPGAITVVSCVQLGLVCGGVDAQGPPVQDDLDAVTFANERQAGQIVFFSTDSDSTGIEGSGAHSQSNAALQCHEEGAEYAEFPIGVGGDNIVFFEASALGLIETTCPDQPNDDDDMDALSWGGFAVGADDDIFFSLSPGSPTLTTLGSSPADILRVRIGEEPSVYRSAASLGLQTGDDIDAICLFREDDVEVFLFSLSRGSPTLAAIGASPADLLIEVEGAALPAVFKRALQYGLLATDNIDAVKCQEPVLPTPQPVAQLTQGDNDCDGDVDSIDALKGLQFVAAIDFSQEPGCPDLGSEVASLFGDVDCDDDVDAVDQLKILQHVAGLQFSQNEGCKGLGEVLVPGAARSSPLQGLLLLLSLPVLLLGVRTVNRLRR